MVYSLLLDMFEASSKCKIRLPIEVKADINLVLENLIEYIKPADSSETVIYVTLPALDNGYMVAEGGPVHYNVVERFVLQLY